MPLFPSPKNRVMPGPGVYHTTIVDVQIWQALIYLSNFVYIIYPNSEKKLFKSHTRN